MAPRLVTARQLDLHFQNIFGELGPEMYVTGHWTAGVKDTSLDHAIGMAREYHREHKAKGWGGIGYHFMILHDGTILCLRPTALKGAHVGNHNSNNIGVVMCGGAGGKNNAPPTIRQMRSFRWLLRNAHTSRMPVAHRTDRSLAGIHPVGHNDWSGHESNACPGTYKTMYRSKGVKR